MSSLEQAPVPEEIPRELLEALLGSKAFKEVLNCLRRDAPPPLLGGVTGSLLSLVAVGLSTSIDRPLLLICPSTELAEEAQRDLHWLGREAALLPRDEEDLGQRLRVLEALDRNEAPRLLVAGAAALLDPVLERSVAARQRLELSLEQELERDALVARLLGAGFERCDVVERSGTFSVRGDVVDFFPLQDLRPLRVEFFGDEVEGLRRFDPGTQLSVEVVKSASALLLSTTAESEREESFDTLLPENLLILRRDLVQLDDAGERHLALHGGADGERRRDSWERLLRRPGLAASSIKLASSEAVNLGGRVIAAQGARFEDALATLEQVGKGKKLVVVGFDTEAEAHRFEEALDEHADELPGRLRGRIRCVPSRIHEGAHSPLLAVALLNHHELFATQRPRRPVDAPDEDVRTAVIDSLLDLQEGDIVVHVAHGLARFVGLEHVEKGGASQDFIALEFKDEVRLLVPTVRIDLVQKYIGGKGDDPELSRFGGRSWDQRKDAVRRAASELALELLELQAMRERAQGIAHAPDSPWQQELEASFPYELTRDQARAIEAIKRDMESSRPMDRLLCGDVGFGKTEVAVRAAFKAAMGGRQVAVLAPTTVLAQQHWNTFRSRMADYPVEVECLSRFQSRAEQRDICERLATGGVDIVIGTHRLVQKDVNFKSLGLLIVDEEQRFGVAHKERLRKQQRNVDVLTMTATPIPRTLNQALMGIRDISSLEIPPVGRQAIATEVVAFDEVLVRTAILRELERGGQVFFIHNRVHSIHKRCQQLSRIVPEASFLVGHGQMPEGQLSEAMRKFLGREADVMVATTIVESGLDIPTVNTLFVDRADLYGLANLHQLRGRVGRYRHQAYAYFLIDPAVAVAGDAGKRLRAIEEFSRLGSGFQIAMRDLQIRGVGNILGAEQSGHIAAVGYDLYCKLLDGAVRALKQERVAVLEDVEINLDFAAFLPDAYIPDLRVRLEIYRRLGRARRPDEFEALLDEMRDRFGPPPEVARELVLIGRIRALLEPHRVRRLDMMPPHGPALLARDARRLADSLRLRRDQIRHLEGGRVLLVPDAPVDSPGRLHDFLQAALPSMEEDRGGA